MPKDPSDLTFMILGHHQRFTMSQKDLSKFDLRGSWAMLFHSVDMIVRAKYKTVVCSPHTTPNPEKFRFNDER